jgi:hypothetical protein
MNLDWLLQPSDKLIRRTGWLLWGILSAMWFVAVKRYAYQFPRADEENFTEVVTGLSNDWWGFMWTPGNEHFSPLVRLYYVVVARLTDWNIPVILYVQVALISLAVLIWLRAVRRNVETPSWLEVVSIFAILSPAAFETWLSACSYAPMFPVYLVTVALWLEQRWDENVSALILVTAGLVLVVLMGLLVGGFLLAGVYLTLVLSAWYFHSRKPAAVSAVFVGVGLLVVLGLTLLNTPQPGHHSGLKAASLYYFSTAVYSNIQFGLFGYMPSFLGACLLPVVLSAILFSIIQQRHCLNRTNVLCLIAALGPLALVAAISYGRGMYAPQTSRYFIMSSLFWVFLLLALPMSTKTARVTALCVFVFAFAGATFGVGPLHHYGQEIRERDRILVEHIVKYSPEAAAMRTQETWGQRPERLVEMIRALKQANQAIFRH